MPAIKPTTKGLTLLAVVAVFFCIVGVLVYLSGSQHLRSERSSLKTKQDQVEDSKKIAGRLEEAQSAFYEAQGELGFLETSVSTYAYVPTLLGQLDELGREHKLRVVAVRPQPTQDNAPVPVRQSSEDSTSASGSQASDKSKSDKAKSKPYEELKITVELEGTYWNVYSFLLSLTRFPKIIAVKELEISPIKVAEQRGSPQLQVRLVVTAFIFKEEAGSGGEPSSGNTPAQTSKVNVPEGRFYDEG